MLLIFIIVFTAFCRNLHTPSPWEWAAKAWVLLLVAADSGANVCSAGACRAWSQTVGMLLGAVDSLKKQSCRRSFYFPLSFSSVQLLHSFKCLSCNCCWSPAGWWITALPQLICGLIKELDLAVVVSGQPAVFTTVSLLFMCLLLLLWCEYSQQDFAGWWHLDDSWWESL